MYIHGVSAERLAEIAETCGLYIRGEELDGGKVRLTLHPNGTKDRRYVKKNNRGICWHGYYAFCIKVFSENHSAKIVTARIIYRSVKDLIEKAELAHTNPDECNCNERVMEEIQRDAKEVAGLGDTGPDNNRGGDREDRSNV